MAKPFLRRKGKQKSKEQNGQDCRLGDGQAIFLKRPVEGKRFEYWIKIQIKNCGIERLLYFCFRYPLQSAPCI